MFRSTRKAPAFALALGLLLATPALAQQPAAVRAWSMTGLSNVSPTSTSAAVALPSAPPGGNLWLINRGAVEINYVLGPTNAITASATTSAIPAGSCAILTQGPNLFIATYAASLSTNGLQVQTGLGTPLSCGGAGAGSSGGSQANASAADPTYTSGLNFLSMDLSGYLRTSAKQSGAWNITNITGTVSLPTGAATQATMAAIQALIGTNASTTCVSGSLTEIGCGYALVQAATSSIPAGTNVVGGFFVDYTNMASVPISTNTAVTTQLVALSSGKAIYVSSFDILAAGTANVTFEYGTGTNCGTGTTALTGAYNLTAQAGVAKGSGIAPVLVVPASNALCVVNSAAVQVSGSVSYVQR